MCFVAAGRAVHVVDVEDRCLKAPPEGLLLVIPLKDVYSSVASDAWEGDCNVGV